MPQLSPLQPIDLKNQRCLRFSYISDFRSGPPTDTSFHLNSTAKNVLADTTTLTAPCTLSLHKRNLLRMFTSPSTSHT